MDFHACQQLAASLPESLPPLAVDIDGTLTDSQRAIDPRVFPVIRAWPTHLVIATGKSMPYPVALCEFLGIEPLVVAENGGVVLAGRSSLTFEGDPSAAQAVLEEYRGAGYSDGWGAVELTNRWRETEIAVSRDSPLEPLESIAAEYGLEVVDTGFAYHVKSPGFTKGSGLERMAESLGLDTDQFVAVGDSQNDADAFTVAGTGIAVANADDTAVARADHVTEAAYAAGFLEAVEWIAASAAD